MRAEKSKIFLIVIAFSVCNPAPTGATEESLDRELRESIHKIEVTVTDMYSRTETKPVVVTVFRPPGDGQYPLLILNHGRAVEAKRHLQSRQRYYSQAKWFVSKGFVVMVPTRIGYGETFGYFDPEFTNSCRGVVELDHKDEALFKQVMAVYEFAKTQSYVDTKKWLIAGQSLGGYTTVTIARRSPTGLIGAINFAGGFGGDPDGRRGRPCGFWFWQKSLEKKLAEPSVPTLWVYWKEDRYWGNDIPLDWFKAFEAGGGKGEFVHVPEIKGDGHSGFTRDMKNWTPIAEGFIKKLPIQLKEVALRKPTPAPLPSGFANIDEIDKVPFVNQAGKDGYKDFISKDSPKAFAINADGKWGWSNGHEDSIDRALGYCNKNAKKPCSLYVVDNDVVWKP